VPLRILLADDHDLVRDGIKPFLKELDRDAEIVEAASFDEALKKAATRPFDLALLDLRMPGMDGLAGIKKIAAAAPGARVVVLSGHFPRREVIAAIEGGAAGYIPKVLSGRAMVNALRLVLSGETYLPSVVLAEDAAAGRGFAPDSPLAALSAREGEILGHVIEGKTNKAIANALGLQEITVKIHLRNVYRKLGAANRPDAVRIALQNGWDSTKP
jgi:DNA-binding NarL/FixJ family response regulator